MTSKGSVTVTEASSTSSAAKARMEATVLDAKDTFNPTKTKDVLNLRPDPVTERLIDSHPGSRTRPMRVLCLGMSRTGTFAMFTALKRLGYNPYHMAVAMASPKTGLTLWNEAYNAKFHGKGKKWGREEFDKVLGDFDSVADVPCINFAEELIAAYPEAKIVITSRDVEAWLKSVDSTVGVVFRWWGWPLISQWDPSLGGPFWEHVKLMLPATLGTMTDLSSPSTPARQAFHDHYALVRRAAPKQRTLEFKVQEGWEPLCEFLDVPVPEEEDFPRVNDRKEFVALHGMLWWVVFAKMVAKIAGLFAIPGAGIAVAIWWRSRT